MSNNEDRGCWGERDPFADLKRAAKNYEKHMDTDNEIDTLKEAVESVKNASVLPLLKQEPISLLVSNILKLETLAKQPCKCPPKLCSVCLAKEYLGALSRMASNGIDVCSRHNASEDWLK